MLDRAALALVAARFADLHIPEPNSGCWLWLGLPGGRGYGRVRVAGRQERAHRVSHEIHVGPVARHLFVCHRCDNRMCVNPAHLFVGTPQDNIADMMAKGRHAYGPQCKPNPKQGQDHDSAKLTQVEVVSILLAVQSGVSQRGLARELGINASTISSICRGKSWRVLPRDRESLLRLQSARPSNSQYTTGA